MGLKLGLNKLLKLNPARWDFALSNELGRLVQGNSNNIAFTNVIQFINFSEIFSSTPVTYANIICDH